MKTYINYFFTGLFLFLAPIQGLLIAVGVAIALDTFTGIFKSVHLHGWHSIRSRKLSNVVSKMLLYQITVILIFLMDKFLLNEFIQIHFTINFMFTKLVAILLLLIELTSIKENIEKALNVDLWVKLKGIFNRAKEIKEDINEITK